MDNLVNLAALIAIFAGAFITGWARYQLKQINRELRQARLLHKQMEEDHAQLVNLYLEIRRKNDA